MYSMEDYDYGDFEVMEDYEYGDFEEDASQMYEEEMFAYAEVNYELPLRGPRRGEKPVKPIKAAKCVEAWPETSAFISNIRTLMDKNHKKMSKEAQKLSMEDVIEHDKSIAENFVCSICINLVDITSAVQCNNCDEIFD